MKILAVCGNGLGTSLFISQNINELLNEQGIMGIEVEAVDLATAQSTDADFYIGDSNIVCNIEKENVIGITDLISKDEIIEKLLPKLK